MQDSWAGMASPTPSPAVCKGCRPNPCRDYRRGRAVLYHFFEIAEPAADCCGPDDRPLCNGVRPQSGMPSALLPENGPPEPAPYPAPTSATPPCACGVPFHGVDRLPVAPADANRPISNALSRRTAVPCDKMSARVLRTGRICILYSIVLQLIAGIEKRELT